MYTREAIAGHIVRRLEEQKANARLAYQTLAKVPHFVVDDVLPAPLARLIGEAFPPVELMRLRSSLRERKYVTAQMNRCNPLVEASVFAFQDPRVLGLVSEITELSQIEPDPKLYAGGISTMTTGQFLNPHLDNSHDLTRQRYRVLNLLYYASPDWRDLSGGALELWPEGPKGTQIEIPPRFNRLVVMATNRTSWHSVSAISGHDERRCISNYYFSPVSPESDDYFHVTSFRGRPEQPFRDLALRADNGLRMLARKIKSGGLLRTRHYYRTSD